MTCPPPGINPLLFLFRKIRSSQGRHHKSLLPPDGIKSFCQTGSALIMLPPCWKLRTRQVGEEARLPEGACAAFFSRKLRRLLASVWSWFPQPQLQRYPHFCFYVGYLLKSMVAQINLHYDTSSAFFPQVISRHGNSSASIISNLDQSYYSSASWSQAVSCRRCYKAFPASLIDQQHELLKTILIRRGLHFSMELSIGLVF